MSIQQFPFSLEIVRESLLVSDVPESLMIKSLKKIQQGFTVSRDKIEKYLNSELDASSYSLFYMPTDFPKLSMILDELPESLMNYLMTEAVDVFDIGCGPGTFSFAWNHYFPRSIHRHTFVDKSPVMLRQAQKISHELFSIKNSTFVSANDFQEIPNENNSIRCIIFGHSINEMGLEIANDYLKKINPHLLIMLGPGTPEVFELFMTWRESSLGHFETLYPCLSQVQCPIWKKRPSKDWCHQVLRSKLSNEINQLGQKLSIDRRTIPFIGHVYIDKNMRKFQKHKSDEMEDTFYTITRFLGETKYSWRYQGCGQVGDNLYELEVMKKLVSKDEVKKIMALCVGQRVRFSCIKVIDGNHFRGTINW